MAAGVAGYCRKHGLTGTGTRIALETATDPESKLISRMDFTVHFPEGFPSEHRPPLLEAVSNCYIKRHLFNPPEVTVKLAD